jgi:transcriptional regulator with XRE-family HTH domain
MNYLLVIGWHVRKWRRENRLTQEAFASQAELAEPKAVHELEYGSGNPRFSTLASVAFALKRPIPALFSTEGVPDEVLNRSEKWTAPELAILEKKYLKLKD